MIRHTETTAAREIGPPRYTDGIPAIDHHSHAGYLRPGATVEGMDGVEREMVLSHVEANLPSDVYLRYVEAERHRDTEQLAELRGQWPIDSLFEEGLRFRETSMHTVTLFDGAAQLFGDIGREAQIHASLAGRVEAPQAQYERALVLAGTPAVLTDVPEIDTTVWPAEKYRQIARIDPYLYPFGHPSWDRRGSDTPRFRRIFGFVLERQYELMGVSNRPQTLDDYLDFVRASLRQRVAGGVVGLKIASAYVRSLRFEDVSRADAAEAYTRLGALETPDPGLVNAVADHVVFAIAEEAVQLNLPVQVHTGVGHAEPGIRVDDANPLHLQQLLDTPRLNQLKVILIHGGFPFTDYLTALAYTHGNVYLDTSLLPHLHGRRAERALEDWLTYLPANKVLFGTDTGNPEHHVTSAQRARAALDTVLTAGVANGWWSTRQAHWLTERVLHRNLTDVYGVEIP
ncbi:hypothetical protein GCM10010399_06970 [Dactylosporangium fulvum]|uniref:Amidohydrolase family protein n=1 Tax=Dactylosporangium fulvum TaxID=53359 RepID=A0ABY5WDV4_9ACTN|nr:amidohydrolase family protein [Dactylosporangium fulvum]UWP86651.1 amidohydrolase family protein [Dactylosporangium fulvum]